MIRIVILACLLLLLGCQSQQPLESNRLPVNVARVVSGQAFDVVGMGEQPSLISQVRLVGIDAPDLRQRPWGEAAKQRLSELIRDGEQPLMVEFDVQTQDKTGRSLTYVWKDQVLLNEVLVKEGYALFVGRSPNHKYDQLLDRAQQWARLTEQGIWNPEKPMRLTPGEFRRQNR